MADGPEPGPKTLPDRLQPGSSVLGRVIGKAERLLALEREIRRLLPENLRDHVNVAGLDTGHLSLFVSSSARATQLRFQQQLLRTRLVEATGEPVVDVSIAVKPRSTTPPENPLPAATGIPAAAATHFTEMAREEPDPALRHALERLARRVR